MRKSATVGGAGGNIDLDEMLLGGQGAGELFEATGGEGDHSNTVKMGKINPFLKADMAARKTIKEAGGRTGKAGEGMAGIPEEGGRGQKMGGRMGQEWEEEAESVMVGDGLLERDIARLQEKTQAAARSGGVRKVVGKKMGGAAGEKEEQDEQSAQHMGGGGFEMMERVEMKRSNSIVRGANISAALVEHIEEIEEQMTDFSARQ